MDFCLAKMAKWRCGVTFSFSFLAPRRVSPDVAIPEKRRGLWIKHRTSLFSFSYDGLYCKALLSMPVGGTLRNGLPPRTETVRAALSGRSLCASRRGRRHGKDMIPVSAATDHPNLPVVPGDSWEGDSALRFSSAHLLVRVFGQEGDLVWVKFGLYHDYSVDSVAPADSSSNYM